MHTEFLNIQSPKENAQMHGGKTGTQTTIGLPHQARFSKKTTVLGKHGSH